LINYNRINKFYLRKNFFPIQQNLIGFKFHCVGRFTRKDRASSLRFIFGKVPLNTLSASIDYVITRYLYEIV